MSDELKPCPFCGDCSSLYLEHLSGTVKRPAYKLVCDNCGGSSRYTDRMDHVEIWNTRADISADRIAALEAQRDELLEALARALPSLEDTESDMNVRGYEWTVAEAARNAIKKAKESK